MGGDTGRRSASGNGRGGRTAQAQGDASDPAVGAAAINNEFDSARDSVINVLQDAPESFGAAERNQLVESAAGRIRDVVASQPDDAVIEAARSFTFDEVSTVDQAVRVIEEVIDTWISEGFGG